MILVLLLFEEWPELTSKRRLMIKHGWMLGSQLIWVVSTDHTHVRGILTCIHDVSRGGNHNGLSSCSITSGRTIAIHQSEAVSVASYFLSIHHAMSGCDIWWLMQSLNVNIGDALELTLHPVVIRLSVVLMLWSVVWTFKEVFLALDRWKTIARRKRWEHAL